MPPETITSTPLRGLIGYFSKRCPFKAKVQSLLTLSMSKVRSSWWKLLACMIARQLNNIPHLHMPQLCRDRSLALTFTAGRGVGSIRIAFLSRFLYPLGSRVASSVYVS